LLQAKNVDASEAGSTEALILKILYASEDEKVKINPDGTVTIESSKKPDEGAPRDIEML